MYNAIDPDEDGGDELDRPSFIVECIDISGIVRTHGGIREKH